MKNNSKKTIKEKIAFLEELDQLIKNVEDRIGWKMDLDEEGNQIPPKEDAYNYNSYKALVELKDILIDLA